MTEKNLGSLVDQIVLGISTLGEGELEGLQIIFSKDALYVYKSTKTGKFEVLLNGRSIQRDN